MKESLNPNTTKDDKESGAMSEMTKDMTKTPSAFNAEGVDAYPTAVVESVSPESTTAETAMTPDALATAVSPTMPSITANADVKIAVCNRKTDKRYKNREVKWGYLVQRCRTPILTTETVQDYPNLSKAARDAAKDVGGFVGGQLKDGIRRNGHVLCRSIGTLDADHINGESENASFLNNLRYALRDTTFFIYSTHSHTPEAPRYRVVILFSREVTEEEYPAVMRMVAHDIGMDYFDDTTYQSNRMMYWPSCPSNGEFFFESSYGAALNPDQYLSRYHDWRDVSEWPMSSRQSEIISRRCKDGSNKLSDPAEKDGIVGAFCAAYPISAAIDRFLPDIYTPTASPNRYDYIPSDSIAGVMVFDDKFVYSFHASDPASGQESNAFDLVRVHRFPDADEKKSFRAMADFASKDTEVKKALLAQKQKAVQSDFAALSSETPASSSDNPGNPDDASWQNALDYTSDGFLKSSLWNITVILEHDPKLKNIVFNQLADNMEIVGAVPWKHPTRFWRDADDAQLITYITFNYGSFSKQNYEVAVTKVADDRSYHPIRDMFAALPAWDGTPRVDSLLIDYLGAEDNEYVRAVTRKSLCAAYMRVHHPGIKFDTLIVLNGAQGIGKSTLIAALGGDWFNDSLNISDMESKAAAEKLQGYWILEIGEMAGMRKTDIEKVKAFISRQDDKYRAAFGRRVTPHPRQCIFFGTTNSENGYLRDITGNRRFWNVRVSGNGKYKPWQLDKESIAQVWAEVKVLAEKGEKLYLDAALEEYAKHEQCEAMEHDEREGFVREYLDMLLPKNWDSMDAYGRMNYIQNPDGIGREKGTIQRTAVSNIEIWCECFGKRKEDFRAADSYAISTIMMRISNWERTNKRVHCGPYGQQRVYERIW